MVRNFRLPFFLSILLACVHISTAQPAALPQTPPTQPNGVVSITLGQSVVPLNGPWKFTTGDSPIDPRTGKYLWAEPDFDDSRWESMDLTPVAGVVDSWNGNPRWVPGWTDKGHPFYMGWAWYRLRVPVDERPGERIAVNSPLQADDGYELFANGELIGSLGKFDTRGKLLASYFPIPNMFLVPPAPVPTDGALEATRTLNIRLSVLDGARGDDLFRCSGRAP
jgi:hypothetical protein